MNVSPTVFEILAHKVRK